MESLLNQKIALQLCRSSKILKNIDDKEYSVQKRKQQFPRPSER